MSSYNMASLHGKWSKQVHIPVGDRWGIPQGTSVADCLNWSWQGPQPPKGPKPGVELLKEETRQSRTYITRTPVPPEGSADYREANSTTMRRAPNPTPGAALQEEVVTTTSHTLKERAPTPKLELAEYLREEDYTTDDFRAGIVGTPVHGTGRTARPKSAVLYSSKLDTPPSFREPAVNGTVRSRSPHKSVRERTPTPVSFKDYLRHRQKPTSPSNYDEIAALVAEQKYGGYPHYHAPSSPDDIEYIVSQSKKAVYGRTPTPGPNATSRGINPKYTVNGHKSLVPVSTDDIMKEKALIQAMREHLFNTQHPGKNVTTKPPTGRSPPKYRVSSRKEGWISDYKPGRPHSTGNMDFYKAMYKNSPAAMKMVGFSPDDEYHTYEAYNSRGGTPQPREAWNGSADHFREWQETTKALAKQRTPNHWKVNKYKNAKSRVDHRWANGMPGSENPGKVSVELDCPDKSDYTVSVRVKNTPVPAY